MDTARASWWEGPYSESGAVSERCSGESMSSPVGMPLSTESTLWWVGAWGAAVEVEAEEDLDTACFQRLEEEADAKLRPPASFRWRLAARDDMVPGSASRAATKGGGGGGDEDEVRS